MPPKYDDATASQKVLALYSLLLLDDRPRSLSELAQRFHCSKPTIMRLMEKIGSFEGVSLHEEMRTAEGRNQKWYWLERTPDEKERRCMGLTSTQMRLLRLSRDIAAPFLPENVRLQLDDSLQRATVLLPPEDRPDKSRQRVLPLVQPAILGGIDYAPLQRTLHSLLTAMDERVVCEIVYSPHNKPERTHEMAVCGMISGRAALYLRGWKVSERGTPHAEHPLFLAVHRIRAVTLTRRTHTLAPPPEEEGFGIMNGDPFVVRARLDASAVTYVRERHFGPGQTIENTDNGDVVLTFTARSEPEVLGWALSFGDCITVLEPLWLVESIAETAQKLHERHSLT